ncbi:MAG: threonine/serine exporter family protein [Coriobacteriia bacterium]|nr:threonine/serine exporter family protein [Coriobacteriia bacterium]
MPPLGEARDKKVLRLAIRAGEIMLKSGAEVYRAEDTVERICKACGFTYVQSFITTTDILVSLGASDREAEVHTALKRIKKVYTDLEKVSLIHAFVGRFTATNDHTDDSIEKAFAELDDIDATDGFSLPIRLLAIVLIATFFTMMNNGSLIDGLSTIAIGVLAYLFSLPIKKLQVNHFIVTFSSCFLAAAMALLVFNLGFCSSLSAMIIGSITVFLPGVPITNSVRDLLSGDMLSGVSRGVESLLTSVAIAGGVGMLLRIAPSPIHGDVPTELFLPVAFLFALFGTMGIAIILNIPRRYLLIVAAIAACGWVVYELAVMTDNPRVIASFLATCTIALIAEIVKRITKDAATLFIIPAIYPLVPGKIMYAAMLQMINNNLEAALSIGSEAVLVAGSIAVALLVVISLTRILTMARSRIKELLSGARGAE